MIYTVWHVTHSTGLITAGNTFPPPLFSNQAEMDYMCVVCCAVCTGARLPGGFSYLHATRPDVWLKPPRDSDVSLILTSEMLQCV